MSAPHSGAEGGTTGEVPVAAPVLHPRLRLRMISVRKRQLHDAVERGLDELERILSMLQETERARKSRFLSRFIAGYREEISALREAGGCDPEIAGQIVEIGADMLELISYVSCGEGGRANVEGP